MAKKGRSEKGVFGTIYHYDEHGRKVGRSEPKLFGGYTNYDNKGKKIGESEPNLFGGYTHYDSKRHKVGSSEPGVFGEYHHKDAHGKSTGTSEPGLFGTYTHKDDGCYVATCVYGSYDCPPVWTLRRFRDETLGATALGRGCIRTYYAISPTLVKWFGKTTWFQNMWKAVLDRFVQHLHNKGVSDTAYEDQEWRKHTWKN